MVVVPFRDRQSLLDSVVSGWHRTKRPGLRKAESLSAATSSRPVTRVACCLVNNEQLQLSIIVINPPHRKTLVRRPVITWGSHPPTWGKNPSSWGNHPSSRGINPSSLGSIPPTWGTDPSSWGKDPPSWGNVPSSWGNHPSSWGKDPQTYRNFPKDQMGGVHKHHPISYPRSRIPSKTPSAASS